MTASKFPPDRPGLEWAAAQADRIIHDNDVEGLKQLLTEYPALLSWQGNEWDGKGGLLGIATGAYADAGDPERERWFTRAGCAELLIDAGAVVMPSVGDGLIESRAKGLLQLFQRRDLLPRTLKFSAALGDLDAVRAALDGNANDPATVNDAFVCAVRFQHEAVASILLERAIALDPALGNHVDGSVGRLAFVKHFRDKRSLDFDYARAVGLWQTFVIGQVVLAEHEADLAAFLRVLRREPWLLGDDCVWLQMTLIERATLHDHEAFIVALLDLEPALRKQPAPSQAIGMALTYGKSHLVPLLTRIWPVPDDLPHAAGLGNLARVKGWFDQSGAPALGDLDDQFPCNDPHARKYDDLHWGAPAVQHVLDTALAWSVINRRFDVADFLLEHGADINTNWNSHEPASILHHLVFLPDSYESMRFLIDRGIDMTIKDYRWDSTAQGWARFGNGDEAMAQWLESAERNRKAN